MRNMTPKSKKTIMSVKYKPAKKVDMIVTDLRRGIIEVTLN